jgi:hypothetical protein
MMPRYIDAEKLIQKLEREVKSCKDPSKGSALGFKRAIFIAQTLAYEQVVPRERYENVLENLKAVLAERGEEEGSNNE